MASVFQNMLMDPKKKINGKHYASGTGQQPINKDYRDINWQISQKDFQPYRANPSLKNPNSTVTWEQLSDPNQFYYQDPNGVYNAIRELKKDSYEKNNQKDFLFNRDMTMTAFSKDHVGSFLNNIIRRFPDNWQISAVRDERQRNPSVLYSSIYGAGDSLPGYGWAQFLDINENPKDNIYPFLDDRDFVDFIRTGFPKIAKWNDDNQTKWSVKRKNPDGSIATDPNTGRVIYDPVEGREEGDWNDIFTYNPGRDFFRNIVSMMSANPNLLNFGNDGMWMSTQEDMNQRKFYGSDTYTQGYDAGEWTMGIRTLPDGTIDWYGLDEYDFDNPNDYIDRNFIPTLPSSLQGLARGLKQKDGSYPIYVIEKAKQLGQIPKEMEGLVDLYIKNPNMVDVLRTGGRKYTMVMRNPKDIHNSLGQDRLNMLKTMLNELSEKIKDGNKLKVLNNMIKNIEKYKEK